MADQGAISPFLGGLKIWQLWFPKNYKVFMEPPYSIVTPCYMTYCVICLSRRRASLKLQFRECEACIISMRFALWEIFARESSAFYESDMWTRMLGSVGNRKMVGSTQSLSFSLSLSLSHTHTHVHTHTNTHTHTHTHTHTQTSCGTHT